MSQSRVGEFRNLAALERTSAFLRKDTLDLRRADQLLRNHFRFPQQPASIRRHVTTSGLECLPEESDLVTWPGAVWGYPLELITGRILLLLQLDYDMGTRSCTMELYNYSLSLLLQLQHLTSSMRARQQGADHKTIDWQPQANIQAGNRGSD